MPLPERNPETQIALASMSFRCRFGKHIDTKREKGKKGLVLELTGN